MSDSDGSGTKLGVPSWQLKPAKTTPEDASTITSKSSRATIIEEAKKFLEKDEILRDASTDKKIAFLESKGLEKDEIQALIGVVRNTEASASSESPISTEPERETAASDTGSIAQQKSASQSTILQNAPAPYIQTTAAQSPARDTPPIITYPEFLTTPTAPSPFVTRSRLLATLYVFGGLSTLLYGTKTYLVTPMLAQLTTSRLSLAETAKDNLRRLVLSLQSVVSEIPPIVNAIRIDEESEDEDPSELFHRDVGVQTSRSPSPSNYLNIVEKTPDSVVEEHSGRLKSLGTSLAGLLQDSTNQANDSTTLSSTIADLTEYLNGLAYIAPSFSYGAGGYGSFAAPKEDDEIKRVKDSIRSVKGALLSARSFPAATAVWNR